jgi:hypothetical protein
VGERPGLEGPRAQARRSTVVGGAPPSYPTLTYAEVEGGDIRELLGVIA